MFKLSKYQKQMSKMLFDLKLTIDNSQILKIIKLSELNYIENKKFIEFRGTNLDNELNKIKLSANKLIETLNYALLTKGFIANFKNAVYNNSFGDINQLRAELLNRYNCQQKKLNVDKNINLDLVIISPDTKDINNNDHNEINVLNNNNCENKDTLFKEYNSNHNLKTNEDCNNYEKNKLSIISDFNINRNHLEENSNSSNKKLIIRSKESGILSTDKNNPKSNNLVIICLPNAVCLEVFCYSDCWTEYYLSNNIYVLLWSYRGYGFSQGKTNIKNIKSDCLKVLNYARSLNRFNKIAVHGISVGSIPSSYIGGLNLVDTVFVDRGFSKLDDIAFGNYGLITKYIFKFLNFYNSDNVKNYTKSKTKKVLSCDPYDSVIPDEASLKNGITNTVIKNLISNNIIKLKNKQTNIINLVDIILDNNIDSFIMTIKRIFEKILIEEEQNKINSNSYDLNTSNNDVSGINNTVADLNHSINISLNTFEINSYLKNKTHKLDSELHGNFKLTNEIEMENNIENIDYLNVDNKNNSVILDYGTEIVNNSIYNYNTNSNIINIDKSNINKAITNVKHLFINFDSAGDSFINLKNYTKNFKILKHKVNLFFNNLLVWGSFKFSKKNIFNKDVLFKTLLKKIEYLIYKINYMIYSNNYIFDNSLKDDLMFFGKMLLIIKNYYCKILFKNYEKYINNKDFDLLIDINKINDINNYNSNANVLSQDINFKDNNNNLANKNNNNKLSKISNYLKDNIFVSYKEAELSSFIINNNIGDFIPLKCGHNGSYSEEEKELYTCFLINNNVIL